MRFLDKLLEFYINSSIHVSIAITCLAAVTFYSFKLPLDFQLLLFIFLASITGYNFIKYAGIAKLHHFSLARNVRVIQIFSFFIFLGLIWSAFYQPPLVLLIAVIMAGFTILYGLPVFSEQRSLRLIPGLKIFVIAFVVSGVTVLMPIATDLPVQSIDVVIELFQRFCLVLVLILPFEIRDLRFDMAQLGTMPQILGVRRTKLLGYLLLGFVLLPEFLKNETHMEHVLGLLFLVALNFIFLAESKIRQKRYFASFWVEAIPIFWFGILIFLEAII